MSQNEGFLGGFITGTIIGGVVGGLVGTILASRRIAESNEEDRDRSLLKPGKALEFDREESIETARRSLEDKIAQLNLAIDDVRQQLGTVDGSSFDADL